MAAPRLRTLTSLRFLAALFIVAYHTLPAWPGLRYAAWPPLSRNLLSLACVGLPFFYALSGFVLFYVYRRELPLAKPELFSFAVKRLARLAPVFYLGLLLSAPFAWESLGRTDPENAGVLALAYFGLSASFLGAWWPESLVFNFPTWSVSVEMFCYAVFPFALPIISRLSRGNAWLGLVLTFGAGALIQGVPALIVRDLLTWPLNPGSVGKALSDFLQLNPLVHLPEFLFGVLLARIWEERNGEEGGDGALLFGLAGTALIVGSGLKLPWLMTTSFLFLPLLGCAIWGGAGPRGFLLSWLERPLFVELGETTYVLYVLHFPYGQWFTRFATADNQPVLNYALYFGSLLLLSWLVHRGLERPVRRWLVARYAGGGK